MRTLTIFVIACGLSLPGLAQEKILGAEAYGVLKSTYAYDKTYPINARKVREFKDYGTTFEKLVFDSFHDGLVPALLAVPSEGDGPFPVVMLLHGLTSKKSNWLENEGFTHGGQITAGLLAQGYAVMALDAQYHGERAVYNNYIDPGEMVFQRGWSVRYAKLIEQTIVDYRRAIDYLETRDDIDTDRLGILGYSMGGYMSFILGAVEPRVKAIVACVTPATPNFPAGAFQFAHDLGGTPLTMMMGKTDQFYSIEQAQWLYSLVPGNDKALHLFDSGHSLPVEYTSQSVKWLTSTLK
jgi:dienelactone hydrolase